MPNKPRDYLEMEEDFCHSFNIISTQADLLTCLDSNSQLADDTLETLGHVCSVEILKIKAMFYELIEGYNPAK